MKQYLGKILICVVPVLIASIIVGWAIHVYGTGRGFRPGIDLVGGTVLVYQLDKNKPGAEEDKLDDLAASLKKRLDGNDLKNIKIRPVKGDPPRVEIEVPGGVDVEQVKSDVVQQGRLEFRILANTTDDTKPLTDAENWIKNHPKELEDANISGEPPPVPQKEPYSILVNNQPGEYTYAWVEVGKEELYNLGLNNDGEKDPDHSPGWAAAARAREKKVAISTDEIVHWFKDESTGQRRLSPVLSGCLLYSRTIPNDRLDTKIPIQDRKLGKKYEYFILTRIEPKGKAVTGDYLSSVNPGMDEIGTGLAVHFTFDSEGTSLFADLTELNKPASKNSFRRSLAIILDGTIRSAPGLKSAIPGGRGMISGKYTKEDVATLVRILRAGALPATIIPTPAAQSTMGATLGEDTIRKGSISVIMAFVAVLLFMAVYYRFAGLVACFALLANLVLTVAFMVVVSATFTLPGLAGLVLMLGMAVDANILIYERLREERERGASIALAIRNGYDRAFPTIIDTHLSSIFTAIVLYIVGNDQLKGFGISLTVGLIISLFTSLYITRTIFDIAMHLNWLGELATGNNQLTKFMHLFKRPNFDFMSIRYYWFTATIVLTIIGGGIFLWRLDRGGLGEEFVGGTAYTGRLREPLDQVQLTAKLRDKAKWAKMKADMGKKVENLEPDELSISQRFVGDNPFTFGRPSEYFTVRTTEKDPKLVQAVISYLLEDDLARVKMSWEPVKDEQRLATLKDAKKRGYLVKFTAMDGTTPSDASLSRVKTVLQEEVKTRSDAAKAADEDKKYLTGVNFDVIPHREGDGQKEESATPTKKGVEERFSMMEIDVSTDVPEDDSTSIVTEVTKTFTNTPQPDRLDNFDSVLAKTTQQRALVAIVVSWGALLLYLWFRFGNWTFGAANVACLIHDLFFTLGVIAGCHYLHSAIPALANFILIEDFKIDLNSVAALLTLVGYSANDTIVVFDRIREVRGKNPALTPQMINDSVNQTLSRTVLASLATWLVVVVLFFFGGEGVHLFSFVMVVGVIVGTYSSIYIASPLLLIFGEGRQFSTRQPEREAQPTRESQA
jgi:SecD/SecF fusion protein